MKLQKIPETVICRLVAGSLRQAHQAAVGLMTWVLWDFHVKTSNVPRGLFRQFLLLSCDVFCTNHVDKCNPSWLQPKCWRDTLWGFQKIPWSVSGTLSKPTSYYCTYWGHNHKTWTFSTDIMELQVINQGAKQWKRETLSTWRASYQFGCMKKCFHPHSSFIPFIIFPHSSVMHELPYNVIRSRMSGQPVTFILGNLS